MAGLLFTICRSFFLLPLISPSSLLLPNPIPNSHYWNSFFYNLILLPNVSKISNPIAFQSWSIGVEEQFYIFWPLILNKINSLKRLKVVMISIVIVIYLLRASIVLNNLSIVNWSFLNSLNKFFAGSRFDNMAIGGYLSYNIL
jgi:peptidoglycan/LPS O-acetylase OafA/YrhL